MTDSDSTTPSFLWYQEYANKNQSVKEEIEGVTQELSNVVRGLEQQLQKAHHLSAEQTLELCEAAKETFDVLRQLYANLVDKVPQGEYFRYNFCWKWPTQQAIFLSSLIEYYECGQLISLEKVRTLLGVESDSLSDFHIDVEDYLIGVCGLPSELSRLAVNCVSMGDFERPIAISRFVADFFSGFKLLNLKNDSLRRKFDAIKYNLKSVEQVVYDLRIRGLVKD
eukprot:m.25689 g.25689  ORF g.25689 m.25689 type:complete len:224 (-) comp5789_c1_seq1:229-900(-)